MVWRICSGLTSLDLCGLLCRFEGERQRQGREERAMVLVIDSDEGWV